MFKKTGKTITIGVVDTKDTSKDINNTQTNIDIINKKQQNKKDKD